MTSGGGGFLTPLGGAAQPTSSQPAARSTSSKSSAYTSLLASARTSSEAHEIRTLVSQASGRASRTLRDWNRKGVPRGGHGAVQRAAAVWRLGGLRQAAESFGLSMRKTVSWLSGKGRRSKAEQDRIERAISGAYIDVQLLVRVRFDVRSGGLETDSDREAELIINISERDVETIDSCIRGGDTLAAIEILEEFFYLQYWVDDPERDNDSRGGLDVRITEILEPRTDLRAQAQYILTPHGVIGPGYAS